MSAVVSHGYGCGGHCAFNWRGESVVALVLGPAGLAGPVEVTDAGSRERAESSPDGRPTTTQTWRPAWRGSFEGDAARRRLVLRLGASTCVSRTQDGAKDEEKPCEALPATLSLACTWEPPRASTSAPKPLPPLPPAWVCTAKQPLALERSTDLPWVFSPGAGLLRRTAGEPRPATRYERK
jgi:hypothetical protein